MRWLVECFGGLETAWIETGMTFWQGLGDVASSCVNEKVDTIPDERTALGSRVCRVVASDGDVCSEQSK